MGRIPLERLGRSLLDLLDTLGELEAASVALVLHEQGIDTTTPAGRGWSVPRPAACASGAKTGAKVEAAIRARLAAGEV